MVSQREAANTVHVVDSPTQQEETHGPVVHIVSASGVSESTLSEEACIAQSCTPQGRSPAVPNSPESCEFMRTLAAQPQSHPSTCALQGPATSEEEIDLTVNDEQEEPTQSQQVLRSDVAVCTPLLERCLQDADALFDDLFGLSLSQGYESPFASLAMCKPNEDSLIVWSCLSCVVQLLPCVR